MISLGRVDFRAVVYSEIFLKRKRSITRAQYHRHIRDTGKFENNHWGRFCGLLDEIVVFQLKDLFSFLSLKTYFLWKSTFPKRVLGTRFLFVSISIHRMFNLLFLPIHKLKTFLNTRKLFFLDFSLLFNCRGGNRLSSPLKYATVSVLIEYNASGNYVTKHSNMYKMQLQQNGTRY